MPPTPKNVTDPRILSAIKRSRGFTDPNRVKQTEQSSTFNAENIKLFTPTELKGGITAQDVMGKLQATAGATPTGTPLTDAQQFAADKEANLATIAGQTQTGTKPILGTGQNVPLQFGDQLNKYASTMPADTFNFNKAGAGSTGSTGTSGTTGTTGTNGTTGTTGTAGTTGTTGANGTPSGPLTTGQQVGTVTGQPGDDDPFLKAKNEIGAIFDDRDTKVQGIVDQLKGMGEVRTSAFDKLFGEESRISRFFSPAIQAVEEQILDTEGLLTTLRSDIEGSVENIGLTQGQFNRVEGQERGELIDQMDKLVRANTRLRAGMDIQLGLSEKEFEQTVQSAQDGIDSLVFQLEQSGMADQEEIGLIKGALQQQLNQDSAASAENRQIASEIRQQAAAIDRESRQEKANRVTAVQDILLQAEDFILKAGVVPTSNFKQVITDVMQMANDGKTLAEMQLAVLGAIGSNPQVRAYITGAFSGISPGGNPSSAPAPTASTAADSAMDALLAEFGAPTSSWGGGASGGVSAL